MADRETTDWEKADRASLRSTLLTCLGAVLSVVAVFAVPAAAAQDLSDDLFDSAEELTSPADGEDQAPTDPAGSFDLIGEFGRFGDSKEFGFSESASTETKVVVRATPASAGVGQVVTLSVRVEMPAGSHTYALSHVNDSATASQIAVSFPDSLEPLDTDFRSGRQPELKEVPGLGVEAQFEEAVTWSRRFRVVSADAGEAHFKGTVDFVVCDTGCQKTMESFDQRITLTESATPVAGAYRFRPERDERPDPVVVQAEFSPSRPSAGEPVLLALTMEFDAGWKGFAVQPAEGRKALPTEIELTQWQGLTPLDEAWRAAQPPQEVVAFDGELQAQHAGRVTWLRRFTATGEPVSVAGELRYQVCSKTECMPPTDVAFRLGEAYQPLAANTAATQSFADPRVFDVTDAVEAADIQGPSESKPLRALLVAAFLGGLILNVMPCVLPVLAIKVMGFVSQAGEDRRQILMLNLAYSAGVIIVFLAFAALAVGAGQGFGQHFQSTPFKVVMSIIVFLSGLSLLGVYEIPIPGFLGATGADHKEGLTGAFLTGGIATLLATPCTGPFIGTALAVTATQPPHETFLIWLTAGIGMASPFLVAAVFPGVVAYLPRPGMWMVWFKQASGFVLMGTTVWLVAFTGIPDPYEGALMAFLVGLAFAAWIWGSFLVGHRIGERTPVYVGSVAATAASAALAVWLTLPPPQEWIPFSNAQLVEHLENGETVLVDFTAEWCTICHVNEAVALNTDRTVRFVDEHGVKLMIADFTHQDPEIARWIQRFGQDTVPLTVIFPQGDASRAIPLSGPFTEATLLEKLEQAVAPAKVAAL